MQIDMLSRSILDWLVLLLTLATVTRSEHYHIAPVDSTDLCNGYRNGTCFTLEQLVQTDLLSGGDNLTLSFLLGDHVLTEQLLIHNFSHVQITGKNTTVVGFHSSTILFVSITQLSIENLSFVGANMRPQNTDQSLIIIDDANNTYIKNCYFMDFELLNQAETHIVKIANTQTVSIESTLFMNNTGRALHIEADGVYITNSEFSRNDGGVYIKSNNVLINNTEFNCNIAEYGGAVKVVSSTVVITRCNFTNNKASQYGGAIHVHSGSVSIFNSELTNNRADFGGGIGVFNSGSVSISNSELTNNNADSDGGAISVYSGSVSISNSELITNSADRHGGAIRVFHSGNLSIFNSELTNNRADYGGAINVYSDSVSISNSELTNNSANYGGAIYVYSDSVSISNSELTNNSANYGGAIYVYSDSVSISNSELTNNSANYGGAIYIYLGSVSISNSELTNNSANYGGAIYIYLGSVSISNSELTNNSANYGGAIYVYSDSVSISNSELTNNSANYGGAIYIYLGSVSISNSELKNNFADFGGAIGVASGSVSLSNSELTNNRADFGGAIGVASGNASISNSELTNNVANYRGGAISFGASGSVFISDIELTYNSANEGGAIYILLSSSLIIRNTDITNNIGSLNIQQSKVIFTGMNIVSNNNVPINAFSSQVEFNGPTTVSNNRGMLGGAISADQSQMYINTEGVIITNNTATFGGGIFLKESKLFVNEPIKIYHNTAQDGGGIYAYSSKVEFQSVQMVDEYGDPLPPNKQSEIAHNIAENNGAGIYADSSTIELRQSYVNICSNTAATNGGGVYLQQSSKLYLLKKDKEFQSSPQDHLYIKLTINNNLAQYGGGIFVADDTQRSACGGGVTEDNNTHTIFAGCFIQTIQLYKGDRYNSLNYFNTFMNNNTATQLGADIYGGLLDRCTANQNAEYHNSSNGLEYIRKIIEFSTKLSISTTPIEVIVCNKSHIYTRKGHTFKISVMAVNKFGNPRNAIIRSSVVSESRFDRLKEGQAKQKVSIQCTELEYNVFSRNSSAQVELYVERSPYSNLKISSQFINISFQPCTCPIGLKPIQSDTECKCDCDPDLQQYQIINCSEENGTIKLESNNNIWIGVTNTTIGSGYVVSNCTFDYCVQKPVIISPSCPDEQCAYNRSGVLCGECKSNFSFVLATSNCKECSDTSLLLLFPFALAGILLVALIIVLNITIATGNIHGLIFYTNIVAANKAIFFPSLNNFVTVFVSWVNLDLGIETCFYNGMTSQAKALLQLVFPTYLFFLMFLIIILSKYFDSFSKLLSNKNPVAALGTLILFSYSKLLRFVIAALQFTKLHYPDSSTKIVWLYDSNVEYFTPKHVPQFFAAAIILIAGGSFTVLLFFGQWFPRCSKVMKWTNNTKYIGFMDAYHAPFTPKHRYWVGLLLFALIAHNLVTAMAPNTSLPVLSSGCIAFGLISLNNRVYKKQFNEYLETVFLLNLGILSIGTLYVAEIHQQQETLTIVSMSIAFILFVTIISYHSHHFILKKTKKWLKIKEVVKNCTTGAAYKNNREPNNAMVMHQFAANEIDHDDNERLIVEQIDIVDTPPYTDGAMEEADSDRYNTPLIIRPATRPDQLREPALDVLAPLTADDYRPAPLPTRVNHRPVVTRTEIGPIRIEV